MLFTTEDMMDEIASHWSHNPNSLFYGIIDEFNDLMEFGATTGDKIIDWRAIDIAEGTTLDLIAQQYQVSRPDSDDEFLRFLIRLKRQIAKADGTLNSLANVIASSLEIDPSTIQILSSRQGNQNVNHIVVKGIPDDMVKDSREKMILLGSLGEATLDGVWIDSIEYRTAVETSVSVGTAMLTRTKYTIESEEVEYG